MVSVMSLQFVAVPFLIILAILRNRKFKEEEEKSAQAEEELEEEDEKDLSDKLVEKIQRNKTEDGRKV